MKKKTFYAEPAYILGLILVAFSSALLKHADFGMSMVVAPAYLIHLKLSAVYPFFSFGMAEYLLQAVIILLTAIILRRFKLSYVFSLVTAVLYGFLLDMATFVVALLFPETLLVRTVLFITGMLVCALGIALLFHTYISPEAYELLVKEISDKYSISISKVKTIYDCSSCVVAIILSFLFFGFGHFEGVKFGTVICALFNGFLIGQATKLLEKSFVFKDALPFRKYFS